MASTRTPWVFRSVNGQEIDGLPGLIVWDTVLPYSAPEGTPPACFDPPSGAL